MRLGQQSTQKLKGCKGNLVATILGKITAFRKRKRWRRSKGEEARDWERVGTSEKAG